MSVKIYKATFRKKDGTARKMFFAKLGSLPKTFLARKVKGTGPTRNLPSSMELVWDIQKRSFRVLNHSTLVEEKPPEEAEVIPYHIFEENYG